MLDKALSKNTVNTAESKAKEYFHITRENILWPLVFLLSLSMIGLRFPLGYLLVPIILINRFRSDKYDFIIMLTLLMDGYSLFSDQDIIIKPYNIAAILALVCLIIVKKPPFMKKILAAIITYGVCLLVFCFISDEPLVSQLYGLRNHLLICYMFVPIAVFSGEKFEMTELFKHLLIYLLIICWFSIIDSVLLGGYFLLPESLAGWGDSSAFYDLNIAPVTNSFMRKTAHFLYILSLCTLPMAKYFKFSKWFWFAFISAILITRTFSFTVAFLIVFFVSQGNWKKIGKYAIVCVIGFTVLYFVDGVITGDKGTLEVTENGMSYRSSYLRIKSHVDQIIDLIKGDLDEETAAALGSTRGAQVIPKMELLYDLDKEWTGFGFLDRTRTTNQKYIIENELYVDISNSEEVAIGVEVVPIEIILRIGYLGLIIHILFYTFICLMIRKLKYASFFYATAGFFVITGIGGFGGLIEPNSLVMVGLSLSAVILSNKDEIYAPIQFVRRRGKPQPQGL